MKRALPDVVVRPMRHRFPKAAAFLLAFSSSVFVGRDLHAGEDPDQERILLANQEECVLGRILSVSDGGAEISVGGEVVAFAWADFEPAFAIRLRIERLDRNPPPTPRGRFALARDCREAGLRSLAAEQFVRMKAEWPDLARVIDLWRTDLAVEPRDVLIARGVEAFFARRDEEAYRDLQKAAEEGPPDRRTELAKKFLRILLNAGYTPPAVPPPGGLSREELERIQSVQRTLAIYRKDLEEAKRRMTEGNSNRMRAAFQEAERSLVQAARYGEVLLNRAPEGSRAREILEDLMRNIRLERLQLDLESAEAYLQFKLWSYADEAIQDALRIEPGNPKAKDLEERLSRHFRRE